MDKIVTKMVLSKLESALKSHDKAYPNGDWKKANDEIGEARVAANNLIQALNLWPQGKSHIGNDAAVNILRGVLNG